MDRKLYLYVYHSVQVSFHVFIAILISYRTFSVTPVTTPVQSLFQPLFQDFPCFRSQFPVSNPCFTEVVIVTDWSIKRNTDLKLGSLSSEQPDTTHYFDFTSLGTYFIFGAYLILENIFGLKEYLNNYLFD